MLSGKSSGIICKIEDVSRSKSQNKFANICKESLLNESFSMVFAELADPDSGKMSLEVFQSFMQILNDLLYSTCRKSESH